MFMFGYFFIALYRNEEEKKKRNSKSIYKIYRDLITNPKIAILLLQNFIN